MVRFRNPSMFVLSAFFVFLLMFPASLFGQEGEGKLVYVIPVEKEVERGLEAFLKRAVDEAMEEGANHIIFEIDTPGIQPRIFR